MDSTETLPPFFQQCGWSLRDWQNCVRFVVKRYPGYRIDEDISQGGCSYTIKLTPRPASQGGGSSPLNDDKSFILQCRPAAFALSSSTIQAADEWYPTFVPSVEEIQRFRPSYNGGEIIFYRMSLIPGRRLSDLLPRRPSLPSDVMGKYHTLLNDLAAFIARAWGKSVLHDGDTLHCDGRVGSSLLPRLRRLEGELPSPDLRFTASRARQAVEAGILDRLPVVFTHGDFLSSNILVEPKTWRVNGVIDWAESEMLPFGLCLYGIEHLLGYLHSGPEEGRKRFTYVRQAEELRRYFVRQLEERVPELRRTAIKEALKLARVVGILLWHGFAWDEGRIDRVVEMIRDAEEAAYLEAFLSVGVEVSSPNALL